MRSGASSPAHPTSGPALSPAHTTTWQVRGGARSPTLMFSDPPMGSALLCCPGEVQKPLPRELQLVRRWVSSLTHHSGRGKRGGHISLALTNMWLSYSVPSTTVSPQEPGAAHPWDQEHDAHGGRARGVEKDIRGGERHFHSGQPLHLSAGSISAAKNRTEGCVSKRVTTSPFPGSQEGSGMRFT